MCLFSLLLFQINYFFHCFSLFLFLFFTLCLLFLLFCLSSIYYLTSSSSSSLFKAKSTCTSFCAFILSFFCLFIIIVVPSTSPFISAFFLFLSIFPYALISFFLPFVFSLSSSSPHFLYHHRFLNKNDNVQHTKLSP